MKPTTHRAITTTPPDEAEYVVLSPLGRKRCMNSSTTREAGVCAVQSLEVYEWTDTGAVWCRCPYRGYGFVKLEPGEWEDTQALKTAA